MVLRSKDGLGVILALFAGKLFISVKYDQGENTTSINFSFLSFPYRHLFLSLTVQYVQNIHHPTSLLICHVSCIEIAIAIISCEYCFLKLSRLRSNTFFCEQYLRND
jgi:hypothetical protein